MTTRCTAALEGQLRSLGENAANFASEFDHWKSQGLAGEYANYLFGKDGGYIRPDKLRHVHLVPLSDVNALMKWNIAWKRQSRRVSDRVLVYASDPTHGHLLIFILDEPHAHEIAQMRTSTHRQLMQSLSVIAERFIQTGIILG
ncbi:type II toxin-antitoxin system YafO family toxin [Variovorax sp. IB41]|uniref:type II toxin-antitoxin system YafO family toxin n=1 Tax=Variovorax sp. IB41 TaxID=2779370 RepID=UPI0018E8372B|nr:type II toxin-antitoxin system YafO family toxin [Variovorax sp. IB41]MBJ2155290.1 type II toxin-antitoxin system YafO family toxin [Variovorax sp. IB41]